MSRTKGSKNKTTIIKERFNEVKKEIKGLSQYEQIRRWFEEFGSINLNLAKDMGWNTFRQRIATLRKNGYVIKCDRRNGVYTMIRPIEVLKDEAAKELGWFEPVVDYTQAKVEPVLWANVVSEDNSKFIVDAPEEVRSVKKSRKQAVLDHLKAYGSINSVEAHSKYDCRCLSHIIYDLRKEGYNIQRTTNKIVKEKSTKVDRDTAYHKYILVDKPIESVNFVKDDVVEKVEDKPKNTKTVKNTFKKAILDHLKTYGAINAYDAIKLYNCQTLTETIYRLRKEGYKITRTSKRVVKDHNPKVDRATSVYEYRLINEPDNDKKDDVKSEATHQKYMLVSTMNGSVLKLGVFDDKESAEKGLNQARELYVNAFNNSANKGDVYLIEDGSIIKARKGLFKTKKELYTTFSIVEV